ncbi:glycoside hydrolase superfamily [Mycena capillaripes]|nr:glycoside hydrolase superfamily [Mycena capillaripes]
MVPSVVWLAVLGALGVSATSDLTPTVDKSKFVSTQGAGFQVNNRQVNCSLNSASCNFRLTCSNFRFIGTNAYWLPILNSGELIQLNGTWFQLVANGTTSINLNETTGIISMAEQHGIYLLFSLTNNWNPLPLDNTTPNSCNPTSSTLSRRDILTNNSLPRNTLSNDYGGWMLMSGLSELILMMLSTPTKYTIIAAFENYTSHIVSRYVNSTAILGWELANDPRCNSSIGTTPTCNTTTITAWHSRIATFIRTIDLNHLISSGTQGFFCADCPKLLQKNTRRNEVEPLTKKRILRERKEARKKTRALKLWSEPPSSGVRVRGKWIATPTRRQDDVGTGSAFDGSEGVDSEDILSIPEIGFGSFQLLPDQNSYAPGDPNLSAFNYTLLAGNLTLSATQLPFGVTDQQRDDAYAQWLQQGILRGLAGMTQYQWSQGNLTAVKGTAISPKIDENGTVPVQSHKGLSPSDGYSIAGVG